MTASPMYVQMKKEAFEMEYIIQLGTQTWTNYAYTSAMLFQYKIDRTSNFVPVN